MTTCPTPYFTQTHIDRLLKELTLSRAIQTDRIATAFRESNTREADTAADLLTKINTKIDTLLDERTRTPTP